LSSALTSLRDIHRERLSLQSSMRDLDGAVRRLDSILVVIVFLICVLILTAMIVRMRSLADGCLPINGSSD
jgi:hypothetical protein